MKLLFVLIISLSFLISCMTSEGALFESVIGIEEKEEPSEKQTPGETGPGKETEPSSDDAEEKEVTDRETGIKVVVKPADAQIFFNNEFVGVGSVLVSPKPGSYLITVRSQGYYPQTVWAQYDGGTLVVVAVSLNEITGYLFLEVDPSGASATVNGRPVSEGVTELQIGSYVLRVRKFGYTEWLTTITILEKGTTRVSANLEEAAFEIRSLDTSRKVFNPKNPGRLGITKVTFEVTSWGEGTLLITDVAGNEVFFKPLASFTTWEHSLEWDGSDSSGRPLPDGVYDLIVEARGRDSTDLQRLRTTVTIDSSAVIGFRSVMSGISGTLFAPLPSTLPQGSFQTNAGIIGHYNLKHQMGRYPTFAAVRVGLADGYELNLQGAIFVGPESPVPFTGGIGFKYKLPDMGLFALGAFGKLTYVANTSVDTFHNYTGLSAGVTAALQTKPLTLTLSPEVVASPYAVIYPKSPQSAKFSSWGYARAGILADFGPLTAGISTSLRTLPFSEGLDLQPPYSAGAEVHWLLPGTQLVLSAYFTGEYRAVNDYYFMGGGGFGFIN